MEGKAFSKIELLKIYVDEVFPFIVENDFNVGGCGGEIFRYCKFSIQLNFYLWKWRITSAENF